MTSTGRDEPNPQDSQPYWHAWAHSTTKR